MKARIVCSSTVLLPEQECHLIEEVGSSSDLIGVSAFVLNLSDIGLETISDVVSNWSVPLFVVVDKYQSSGIYHAIPKRAVILQEPLSPMDIELIIQAAERFDYESLPPFTRTVGKFISRHRPTLACPGHQGGKCLDSHPAGARFKQLVGPLIFKLDVPHAAPELGDVLGHEGPVRDAEALAAKVFGADETFFVLNGTSTSNKIVTSALLTAGDFVLMDRNNHKSIYQGALVQSGAIPVYLENFRDSFGVLGGYKAGALDEDRIRREVRGISKEKSESKRPFRLAIIQHATCDGVVLDAGALISKIGHLCDYILFDSAWSGYEQFVNQLTHFSPLTSPVDEDTPGIIVTQSVHKQMSGLSQTSQIHKRDKHLAHTRRYCSRSVFNSAFMLHSSTSPFYPLFMSLEVNAAIHAEGHGQRIWGATVKVAEIFRSMVASRCRYIIPYQADRQDPLSDSSLSTPLNHLPYSSFKDNEETGFHQYIELGFHYLDPCKVIFVTKSLAKLRESHGSTMIPACVIAAYLKENAFTPEKSDFYNFTLLVSPSTEASTLTRLVNCLEEFESLWADDALVSDVLPSLCSRSDKCGKLTLKQLCENLNELYKLHDMEDLQSKIFSSACSIKALLTPYQANRRFIQGRTTLVPVRGAVGKVAAETVIPYPPGVVFIAPGERWDNDSVTYLLGIEAICNCYPEFAPHVQGVYEIENLNGPVYLAVNVLD